MKDLPLLDDVDICIAEAIAVLEAFVEQDTEVIGSVWAEIASVGVPSGSSRDGGTGVPDTGEGAKSSTFSGIVGLPCRARESGFRPGPSAASLSDASPDSKHNVFFVTAVDSLARPVARSRRLPNVSSKLRSMLS